MSTAVEFEVGDVFQIAIWEPAPTGRFLNGNTHDGTVDGVANAFLDQNSGTLWQIDSLSTEVVNGEETVSCTFTCLNFWGRSDTSQDLRYLSSLENTSAVGLATNAANSDVLLAGRTATPETAPAPRTRWRLEHHRVPNGSSGPWTNEEYFLLLNETTGQYLAIDISGGGAFLVDTPTSWATPSTRWTLRKMGSFPLPATKYQNPVVNQGEDPWVVREGVGAETAYYYCYYRNNAIYVSKSASVPDIGRLENTSCVFKDQAGVSAYQNIWAPSLRRIQGVWYIIFACGPTQASPNPYRGQRLHILASTLSDPTDAAGYGAPFEFDTGGFAIDATLFTGFPASESGASETETPMFMVWSGQNADYATDPKQVLMISQVALTETAITMVPSGGSPAVISEPTHPWEKVGYDPSSGTPAVNEGPVALLAPEGELAQPAPVRLADRLHITYSASGSWTNHYCLGRLTFKGTSNADFLNPDMWVKNPEPVFQGPPGDEAGPYAPGHASFVEDEKGTWWIVYHCARYSYARWSRWVQTQPFVWDGDTPVFGDPVRRLQALDR